MKRAKIMVVLLLVTLVVTAQRRTEYNRLGDEAMEHRDFSIAKIYYEEGIPSCDSYSIDKLTFIWLEDESMRITMRNVMSRCMECLINRATELKDTASMNKLILYYTEGIGINKNEAKVEYWKDQRDLLRHVSVTTTTNRPPREKVKMKFFAGYSASYYAPYGLTVGGAGRTVGWYLRFRTNMSFQDYAANVKGEGDDMRFVESVDVIPKTTGEYKNNLWIGTGGIVIKAMPSFYISVGAGYCNRESLYKVEKIGVTVANSQGMIWTKDIDKKYTFNGLALDLDATFRMGKMLYGSIGCSMLNFEYASANAGIGVFF
ncbi:MAG: hypothetical protein LBS79_04985 [Tannerella sp.]|jgi:hypothetical protein|nr:hypothetical protein [Tannerella sp.]